VVNPSSFYPPPRIIRGVGEQNKKNNGAGIKGRIFIFKIVCRKKREGPGKPLFFGTKS